MLYFIRLWGEVGGHRLRFVKQVTDMFWMHPIVLSLETSARNILPNRVEQSLFSARLSEHLLRSRAFECPAEVAENDHVP